MHGAIGPSCAVAQFIDGTMTVWTHTQGVYPLRAALAGLLRMPAEQVHCIQTPGSGCYGHNGADDVAGDAVLIARAVPGRPVRVQWMREQEHTNEPYGPAMIAEVEGALDTGGNIIDWDYGVWSNTHNRRPNVGGLMLQNAALPEQLPVPPPAPIPMPEGGGDRNSNPIYALPNARVVSHFIPDMPLRISALRSLGAYLNVFAIESFMDELAEEARADPVEFRLRHLKDDRAKAVISLAAENFNWAASRRGEGRGFAFARYKNLGPIAPSRWHCGWSMRPAKSASAAWSPPWIAARRSIQTESATRSKAPSCKPQAGHYTNPFVSTAGTSSAATGAAIRSCDSPRFRNRSPCTLCRGPGNRSSAPERRGRAQPPPRSPTRCGMRPGSGCGTCRSARQR